MATKPDRKYSGVLLSTQAQLKNPFCGLEPAANLEKTWWKAFKCQRWVTLGFSYYLDGIDDMDNTIDLSDTDLESRKRFARSVKAHLTESCRMTSSSPMAKEEPEWFLKMVEELRRQGVTPEQVDERLGLK